MISLLTLIDFPDDLLTPLTTSYKILKGFKKEEREAILKDHASEIKAILTNGATGASKDLIGQLPNLKIISCLGAGFEGVDLESARAHKIAVTNGQGANAECVADHAMGLLLSIVRDIPALGVEVREGAWRHFYDSRPQLSGKRLGIFGMGVIGMAIAKRAAAFNLEIGYHNRSKRSDVSYTYYGSLLELAQNSDFIIISSPGGADTYHKINSEILKALGPKGFLVNVARGSVVDSKALVAALKNKEIAGAALDVVEGEPTIPDYLLNNPKIILTPHMAGRSPESMEAMVVMVHENLNACFAGKTLVSQVN